MGIVFDYIIQIEILDFYFLTNFLVIYKIKFKKIEKTRYLKNVEN